MEENKLSLKGDQLFSRSITFFKDRNVEVGRLFINDEGQIAFEGDIDASAEILFRQVLKMVNENLK